jgi:hypothetical protein
MSLGSLGAKSEDQCSFTLRIGKKKKKYSNSLKGLIAMKEGTNGRLLKCC